MRIFFHASKINILVNNKCLLHTLKSAHILYCWYHIPCMQPFKKCLITPPVLLHSLKRSSTIVKSHAWLKIASDLYNTAHLSCLQRFFFFFTKKHFLKMNQKDLYEKEYRNPIYKRM